MEKQSFLESKNLPMITKIVHSGARNESDFKAHVYKHYTMPSVVKNKTNKLRLCTLQNLFRSYGVLQLETSK